MLNRLKANLADFFQQADLVLLALCCTATLYGIVLIFSATRYLGSNKLVVVQFVAMLLGICMYITFSMVDLEVLMKRWKWVLAFNILFILLLRTPLGISRGGNRAWLKFPGIPVNIGPAEVVKITFVLLLAKQLEWLREEKRDLKSFPSALMVGAHAIGMCGFYFLVSGDMGNGLVFLFIFICMAFVAGFALRWFVLLFGGGTAAVAAAWKLGIMPDYMQGRFLALFDHNYDPLGVGWHQNRSLLTLGAGGWFGQGYLKGTQTQSADSWSLPGRHTDFIFSVCGEELGLVGCLAVIALLAAIIIRVLLVAKNSQTSFYCCVCVGMAAMLIFQTLINIGMCLFIMPTIGITLPFFSYGGSSIVTLFAAMGVVSGIKKRSPTMRRPGRPIC
ncbi:MAG: FtsW/RodA/SpoVE family cell cycle protein [Clostridiales bacterium]|nr:FtsW/RodA/SpoVE family cell cycle protein [Clostridiales bacterium]